LRDFKSDQGLNTPKAMTAKKAIDDTIKEMIDGEKMFRTKSRAPGEIQKMGSEYLTPKDIQAKKLGYYRNLAASFQKSLQQTAETTVSNQTAMMMAANMRRTIEALVPEASLINVKGKLNNKVIQLHHPGVTKLSAKQINKLESSKLELMNAIHDVTSKKRMGELFSFQIGQKMATIGVAGTIATAALGLSGEAKILSYAALGTGIALGIVDSSPAAKSALARYLNDLRSFGIHTKPTGAMIRLGLYETTSHGYEAGSEE